MLYDPQSLRLDSHADLMQNNHLRCPNPVPVPEPKLPVVSTCNTEDCHHFSEMSKLRCFCPTRLRAQKNAVAGIDYQCQNQIGLAEKLPKGEGGDVVG